MFCEKIISTKKKIGRHVKVVGDFHQRFIVWFAGVAFVSTIRTNTNTEHISHVLSGFPSFLPCLVKALAEIHNATSAYVVY
nr:MAG TPA: hypothetical protein [Caudoviricetes sp.]